MVDVRDAEQVLKAVEGMDSIMNLSVLRHDPDLAFEVNTLGAYNVMKAAVAHNIRRVVHTGPQYVALHNENDYTWDYDVAGDIPPRPGAYLYGHSKYLTQEICRVFAEFYGIEVPVLLYSQFVSPKEEKHLYYFAVTWDDSGRALQCALKMKDMPSYYELCE